MKLKELFYYWAFLDIERTCDAKKTYFGIYSRESGRTNLIIVRYLSAFIGAMSVVVLGGAFALKAPGNLINIYILVAVIQAVIFFTAHNILKKREICRGCNLLAAAYLFQILIIGSYIGTFVSPDEGASIYYLALLLSQIIFILPPLFTGVLAAFSTVLTVYLSFIIKSDFFFRIDLLNCIGVYIISLLVGWMVNKMKVEEAFTRTKVQKLNSELKALSTTDQLTGLPNHRSFQEVYYERFEYSLNEKASIGVIMMDIDQFKAYNDNYGHMEGDNCLKALGNLLSGFQSDEIYLCRFGGEEFVALLRGGACNRAEDIAEKIRESVQALAIPHEFSRVESVVTVSTGLFIGIPSPGDMPMEVIDKADRAMYQSKADGGNRLTVFGALSDKNTVFSGKSTRGAVSAKRKVLVVDDNDINRELLCWILEDDYETLQAQDGRQAMDILTQNPGALSAVMLDLLMPVMDGYEVITAMREDSTLSAIPVIVTTANTASDAEVKALSLGANDFITKPYQSAVIRHRLANTINLRETAAFVNSVEKDTLTGIYNKEFFLSKAQNLIKNGEAGQYDIICSDIERFKLVNELFGEDTGDDLLKYIAQYYTVVIGKEGVCGRIGSDKFACILPHREDYTPEEFEGYSDAIDAYLPALRIKLRFGVYKRAESSVSAATICDRALTAANSIRGKYGEHFAYYDENLDRALKTEQLILESMNDAVVNEEFLIYYQPKYSLETRRIIGAEALVRWQHPKNGLISPGDFIPLFEKSGFITDLDRYVWERVLSDMSRWQLEGKRPLPISVNMSRADIYDPFLTATLTDLTKKYSVPPSLFHLEITESAYMQDSFQLIQVVSELKALGFPIEMDDFGNGYSSLNMLSELPLNILKLDSGFIRNQTADAKKEQILSVILSLAEKMGLPVVAEGVETTFQEESLKKMGCPYAQGYLYAKPMPGEEFERFIDGARGGEGSEVI